MNACAIGIDLGGTNIKGVAVTEDGKTLLQTNLGFEVGKEMAWADQIRGMVRQIQNQVAPKQPSSPACSAHVGVSAPGLATADRRSISHMPGRLQGLEGLDSTEFLGTDHPVPVLNDAQAALRGECWI